MANTRDIRRRIKSIKSTQKITKAMKMVSASKLRRAQTGVVAARPYTKKLVEVLGHISGSGAAHAYLEQREVKKTGFVVMAGSRGLCGGYNANIYRLAEETLNQCPNDYGVITIGSKAREYFKHHGSHEVIKEVDNVSDAPTFAQGKELADTISKLYLDGTFDEVYMIYTEFKSAISQSPVCKQILPVPMDMENVAEQSDSDYIFEPDEAELIATLLPQYLQVTVYQYLLEAKASEHGARMTAMSSATDNATEMIGALTLSLNRARQAAITTEISEIVGGAAALN